MPKRYSKNIILKILKEHPEGLTIQKIAEMTKMSRITATKFIHELIGSKKLYERKVGAARLFSLKERFLESVEEAKIIKKIRKEFK